MNKPLFSIIIPVFCGGDRAEHLMHNIVNQNLHPSDFEIIFVDDGSPDNTSEMIKNAIRHFPDCDAYLLTRQVNGRQGAARNDGIKIARGRYVLFLDHDDDFIDGALPKLKKEIESFEVAPEIVTFDFNNVRNGVLNPALAFADNPTDVFTGKDYIVKCAIPWTPWEYAYSLDLLKREKLCFEENVRMEDSDFVMRCTLAAKSIAYRPLPVVAYYIHQGQTSGIGNDHVKIEDMFKNADRVGRIALEQMKVDQRSADVIAAQYRFKRTSCVKRYLWRLNFSDIYQLLRDYPCVPEISDKVVNFTSRHPAVCAFALITLKPFLLLAWRIKVAMRRE